MLQETRILFDHSRHKFSVRGLDTQLDLLAFEGEEALSQVFTYRIEFTSSQQDIPASAILGQDAQFSLYPPPVPVPYAGMAIPPAKPLRTLYGVVSRFRRLSGSRDEAHYEVLLQPRLAQLGRGKQYRIYLQQSVPEIVESILRSDRHHLRGQDFLFDLKRGDYPSREQVMQYGESDLSFIERILAEAGIWYRFTTDERLKIDVVEFHDDQSSYQFDVRLPLRLQSGTSSSGQDAVWRLQAKHGVVDKEVYFRTYDPRNAGAYLDGDIDQTRGDTTTYGEAYHYAEPYTVLGDRYDQDAQLESGFSYARLRHERYLNAQTCLSGCTSSAFLAPGQVLSVDGGAPEAFGPGAVITHLRTCAARDRSFEANFDAIPYAENICFRPPLLAKPVIAGTIPARVSSPQPNDLYGHIDREGRYRVSFLFDRDTPSWRPGHESMWVRLARPYAGETHGFHFPLIQGTEVAIFFLEGDIDKPYISHALHDSRHPDLVTLRNYRYNRIRTPADNELRIHDLRGQEHIHLRSPHSGQSQLNLGHLATDDLPPYKRGEGFELRTDAWGALRAGKGLFISADAQPNSQGQVLAMQPAEGLLKGAVNQMAAWAETAQSHHSLAPERKSLRRLQADATQLSAPALLLSAPNGIAAVSPQSILLDSAQALYLQSAGEVNLASEDRLHANSRQAMSLLAQEEGMRLVSGKGPFNLESHADTLSLIAQKDITVQSTQGHLQITAKQGITLASGGAYIRLSPDGKVEVHGPTMLSLKGQHRLTQPTSQDFPLPELPTSVCKDCLKRAQAMAAGFATRES